MQHLLGGEENLSLVVGRRGRPRHLLVPAKDCVIVLVQISVVDQPPDLLQPRQADQDTDVVVVITPNDLLQEACQQSGLPHAGGETAEMDAGWAPPLSHGFQRGSCRPQSLELGS